MIPQNDIKNINITDDDIQTNVTYGIDFENKRMIGKIDNLKALEQAILMILSTARYENIIFSFNYGNELSNIIGHDFEFIKSEAERYVKEAILADSRFKEIEYYENNPTEVLPMCSNEERFREPDKYAVMKKGAKRAIKLYDNHEDAKNHASTDDNLYIEVRPGTDKKCLEYCNVCQFCDYWKNNYKDKEVK